MRLTAVSAAAVLSIVANWGAEVPDRQRPEQTRPFLAAHRKHVVVRAEEAVARGAPVTASLGDGRVVAAIEGEVPPDLEIIAPEAKVSAAASFDLSEAYYLVVFHSDTERERADRVLLDERIARVEHPDLLPAQRLVVAAADQIHSLVEHDEVAYVFPASEDLASGSPVFGCMGPLMDGGAIAQYVATVGTGWDGDGKGNADLTFSLSQLTDRMTRAQIEALVQRALAEWSRHAAIRFSPSSNAAAQRNLNLQFAAGAHGDSYPFDGKGRVLAHTFYPAGINPEPLAGDVHFDADEVWSEGGQPDLYSVVLHEIGHALGIGHSDRPGAVMYPYYRTLTALQADDIAALQRLYAPLSAGANTPETQPVPTPVTPPVTPPPVVPPPPAQPSRDTTPPTVAITTPSTASSSTASQTARIAGTARDTGSVASVYWQRGADTGTAVGTDSWSFDLPLLRGNNTIIVRAKDGAGNIAWRSVVITRR